MQGSMVLSQIHQAIDASIFEKIANAKTAKQAWDNLAKTYKGVDRVQKNNLLMLKRKFELITMKNLETIESYFFILIDIKNEMEHNAYDLSNEVLAEKALNTLPMKFDHVVAGIQEAKDLSTMTIEELQGQLTLHKQKINEKLEDGAEKETVAKALQVQIDKPKENGDGSGQKN